MSIQIIYEVYICQHLVNDMTLHWISDYSFISVNLQQLSYSNLYPYRQHSWDAAMKDNAILVLGTGHIAH